VVGPRPAKKPNKCFHQSSRERIWKIRIEPLSRRRNAYDRGRPAGRASGIAASTPLEHQTKLSPGLSAMCRPAPCHHKAVRPLGRLSLIPRVWRVSRISRAHARCGKQNTPPPAGELGCCRVPVLICGICEICGSGRRTSAPWPSSRQKASLSHPATAREPVPAQSGGPPRDTYAPARRPYRANSDPCARQAQLETWDLEPETHVP